jgi:hypothetical protein
MEILDFLSKKGFGKMLFQGESPHSVLFKNRSIKLMAHIFIFILKKLSVNNYYNSNPIFNKFFTLMHIGFDALVKDKDFLTFIKTDSFKQMYESIIGCQFVLTNDFYELLLASEDIVYMCLNCKHISGELSINKNYKINFKNKISILNFPNSQLLIKDDISSLVVFTKNNTVHCYFLSENGFIVLYDKLEDCIFCKNLFTLMASKELTAYRGMINFNKKIDPHILSNIFLKHFNNLYIDKRINLT